ncbi:MAG TPA: hypothetical protein VLJ15_02460 [Gammaproteobacteria bacterium]|nr:hypothetical protein [Gammaproteobacteria bacterium]
MAVESESKKNPKMRSISERLSDMMAILREPATVSLTPKAFRDQFGELQRLWGIVELKGFQRITEERQLIENCLTEIDRLMAESHGKIAKQMRHNMMALRFSIKSELGISVAPVEESKSARMLHPSSQEEEKKKVSLPQSRGLGRKEEKISHSHLQKEKSGRPSRPQIAKLSSHYEPEDLYEERAYDKFFQTLDECIFSGDRRVSQRVFRMLSKGESETQQADFYAVVLKFDDFIGKAVSPVKELVKEYKDRIVKEAETIPPDNLYYLTEFSYRLLIKIMHPNHAVNAFYGLNTSDIIFLSKRPPLNDSIGQAGLVLLNRLVPQQAPAAQNEKEQPESKSESESRKKSVSDSIHESILAFATKFKEFEKRVKILQNSSDSRLAAIGKLIESAYSLSAFIENNKNQLSLEDLQSITDTMKKTQEARTNLIQKYESEMGIDALKSIKSGLEQFNPEQATDDLRKQTIVAPEMTHSTIKTALDKEIARANKVTNSALNQPNWFQRNWKTLLFIAGTLVFATAAIMTAGAVGLLGAGIAVGGFAAAGTLSAGITTLAVSYSLAVGFAVTGLLYALGYAAADLGKSIKNWLSSPKPEASPSPVRQSLDENHVVDDKLPVRKSLSSTAKAAKKANMHIEEPEPVAPGVQPRVLVPARGAPTNFSKNSAAKVPAPTAGVDADIPPTEPVVRKGSSSPRPGRNAGTPID